MHFFSRRKSGPLLHGYGARTTRKENGKRYLLRDYLGRLFVLLALPGKIARNKWTALIICTSPLSLLPFVINPGLYLCILYSPGGGNYRNIKWQTWLHLFVTRVIINEHPLALQRDGNIWLMNFRKCNWSSRFSFLIHLRHIQHVLGTICK